MKSPITDKEMPIKNREETLTYKGEAFVVLSHYYICEDSKEEFTNDSLVDISLDQVYREYYKRHNLPYIPNML